MPKRVLSGTVVSDKGDKTVVVRVERRVKHPLYGKIIRLSKKYHAHDEGNAYREGEQVRIEECPPVSKLKSWTVLDRIGAAPAAVEAIDEVDIARPVKEAKAVPKAVAKPAPKAAAKPEKPAKTAKPVKPAKAAKGKAAKAAEPEAADA